VRDVLLPDDLVELLGAVLAGEDEVTHGEAHCTARAPRRGRLRRLAVVSYQLSVIRGGGPAPNRPGAI
jgi:hypothetical protein